MNLRHVIASFGQFHHVPTPSTLFPAFPSCQRLKLDVGLITARAVVILFLALGASRLSAARFTGSPPAVDGGWQNEQTADEIMAVRAVCGVALDQPASVAVYALFRVVVGVVAG